MGKVSRVGIVPAVSSPRSKWRYKVGAKYKDAVRTDSTSSLETIGVLGDTVVDINSKMATGPPIQNNAELRTNETPNLSPT